MIHSRKKGVHIGWMLLLLLVLSMGIASVQASAAIYYSDKLLTGSMQKINGLRSVRGRTYFLKSGRMAVRRMQKLRKDLLF